MALSEKCLVAYLPPHVTDQYALKLFISLASLPMWCSHGKMKHSDHKSLYLMHVYILWPSCMWKPLAELLLCIIAYCHHQRAFSTSQIWELCHCPLFCVLYPIEDVNGVKLIVVVDECSCANFSNGMLLFVVNKLFMFTFLSYHSCVVMTAYTSTTESFFKPVNLLRHYQHAISILNDKCIELAKLVRYLMQLTSSPT